MSAELIFHLNPTLRNGLTKRRVRHDLAVLVKAPNIEAIHVYPDINQELPGVGVPVGVSILTAGLDPHVYPTAVTDANDGYRLIRLDVRSDELHACGANLLATLESLRNPWRILQPSDIDSIVTGGLQALEGFGFPKLPGEPMRVADQGNVLITNPNVLHPLARHALENFAGQFGSYGHFLEFLALETPVASLGMDSEDVLLVIHGGAMQASEHVFWDAYFNFAQICAEDGLDSELILSGLSSLPISHQIAQNFVASSQAMVNAGYFWRAILHRRIIACLENVLQRSIYSEVLSDLPHNRLEQTERGFLHAKGVQRLEYGFPVVVCGDLGGRSALMLPNQPERTAFGCCHGRARHPQLRAFKMPPTPRAPWTNHPQSLPSNFQQRLLEQNLDDAVNSMTAQGATSHLASLFPVLNFRGDPKHHVQQLASTYLPTHGEQQFTQVGERG